MFNRTFTNPLTPSSSVEPTWPFALPEPLPPSPHSLSLFSEHFFQEPVPFFSSLYNLPITPQRPQVQSTPYTPTPSALPNSPQPDSPSCPNTQFHSSPFVPIRLDTPECPSAQVPSVDSPLPTSIPPSFSSSPTPNVTSFLPDAFPEPDTLFDLPTTHATRNPHLSVQESRTHLKLSEAQKATRTLKNQAMKEKHELLSKDLQKLQEKHEKEYEDLARAHFVTVEYIT